MSVFRRLYRGETRINFIGTRRRWYAASGVLILICILSFIFRGFNYSIEFSGGSSFQINVAGTPITADQAATAISNAGISNAGVPEVVGTGSYRSIVIDTGALGAAKSQHVQHSLATTLRVPLGSVTYQTIGSSWGHDTTVNALEGLIVFLIAVSLYMALRFHWRMAVGGIVALAHDLIVAAGVYSLVGFQVSPSTIVGLLTILGFSLYDTVVVYDKVAENAKDILGGTRMTFGEAANLAVNQTLMRSINTSLIALLPVAGLLFVGAGLLGVGTIKDLALILFVGLASGAYSSLFLATPIVVDLTERDPRYKALTKRVMAKRASERKKLAEAGTAEPAVATAGSAAIGAHRGAPAPAPRPGARPQQRPRRRR